MCDFARYLMTDWKEEAKMHAEEKAKDEAAVPTTTSATSLDQSELKQRKGGGRAATRTSESSDRRVQQQDGIDMFDTGQWESTSSLSKGDAMPRFSVDSNKAASQPGGVTKPTAGRQLSAEELEQMKRRKEELLAKREAKKKTISSS